MNPHLHFMGIGGVSMRALARHYRAAGFEVSGCDAVDSEAVRALRADGIAVAIGHDPRHCAPLGAGDTLVHTMAVPDPRVPSSGAEVDAARSRGVRVLRRIELLAELMAARRSVGVTGTHGKSTTSAMVATLLMAADVDPAVQLGATLPALGGNMRFGSGPLVAEVDESDPGFAELGCSVAVVTNLEDDHVAGEHDERRTYHASLADLEAATVRFAERAGGVAWSADWPRLDELLRDRLPGPTLRYGFAPDADLRIEALELEPHGSRFELRTASGRVRVRLRVPGRHNAENAAAALAGVALLGHDPLELAPALAAFPGVGRRWQLWGEVAGALVIDDYAHHPTEVRAALAAARPSGRRVRVVLQPHRWVRTARLWRELADAAASADEVIVLDVYGSGEAPIEGIGPERIAARIRAAGGEARHLSAARTLTHLRSSLRENDLVLTLGAGDVWRIAERLVLGSPDTATDTGADTGTPDEGDAAAERGSHAHR